MINLGKKKKPKKEEKKVRREVLCNEVVPGGPFGSRVLYVEVISDSGSPFMGQVEVV